MRVQVSIRGSDMTVVSGDTQRSTFTIRISYGVFAGGHQLQLDHLGPGQSVTIPAGRDSRPDDESALGHDRAFDGPPSVSGRKLYISEDAP